MRSPRMNDDFCLIQEGLAPVYCRRVGLSDRGPQPVPVLYPDHGQSFAQLYQRLQVGGFLSGKLPLVLRSIKSSTRRSVLRRQSPTVAYPT